MTPNQTKIYLTPLARGCIASAKSGNGVFRQIDNKVTELSPQEWADQNVVPYGTELHTKVARLSIENLGQTFGASLGFNLPDLVMRDVILRGGKRMGLVDLNASTKRAMFRALTDARAAGDGVDGVVRRIYRYVPAGKFVKAGPLYRSYMIARTESKFSQNESVMQMMEREESIDRARCYDGLYGPPRSDLECISRNGRVFSLRDARRLIQAEHPNGTRSFVPEFEAAIGSRGHTKTQFARVNPRADHAPWRSQRRQTNFARRAEQELASEKEAKRLKANEASRKSRTKKAKIKADAAKKKPPPPKLERQAPLDGKPKVKPVSGAIRDNGIDITDKKVIDAEEITKLRNAGTKHNRFPDFRKPNELSTSIEENYFGSVKSWPFNDKLRNGKKLTDIQQKTYNDMIEDMRPLKENIRVWRGDTRQLIFKEGDVISDPAFLSHSTNPNLSSLYASEKTVLKGKRYIDIDNPNGTLFQIDLPKGQDAVVDYMIEQEVVLPPNVKFRVVKVNLNGADFIDEGVERHVGQIYKLEILEE